ncbi:MAG TPA: methyltransferase domain-containing protein [Candidatus Limnocylindrales bacterium]|nr:methyltransferase domain-containing protein [Candidatus Limnocylindrales bacterium]
MIIDIGTGDGRAVLARARAEPASLVIGVDAAAASMAETSRRADRRGPHNAAFFAAGAEALASSPFAGTADQVTVTFPWGSLLRGLVGLEELALQGVAATLTRGGRLEVLASVVPADRIDSLDCLDDGSASAIASAWSAAGLRLTAMRPATRLEIKAANSSWARRLGPGRPVWRLEGALAG